MLVGSSFDWYLQSLPHEPEKHLDNKELKSVKQAVPIYIIQNLVSPKSFTLDNKQLILIIKDCPLYLSVLINVLN